MQQITITVLIQDDEPAPTRADLADLQADRPDLMAITHIEDLRYLVRRFGHRELAEGREEHGLELELRQRAELPEVADVLGLEHEREAASSQEANVTARG